MSVPMMSAASLKPVLWDFLILRLVLEVFKVVNTLYVLEGIDMCKLPLDLFQQQLAVLGAVQLTRRSWQIRRYKPWMRRAERRVPLKKRSV